MMPPAFLFALVFSVSLLWRSDATSAGSSLCSATVHMGCTKWGTNEDGRENRLSCIDPKAGPMPWAMSPTETEHYTVRSGDAFGARYDDPTTYIPDTYMSIYVRVTKYDFKYRGLVMHAVDESGSTVGEWEFADDDHLRLHFKTPSMCKEQVMMHKNADPKPYGVRFRFFTPSKGTGRITFKALFKRGPANHGWFHTPAVELLLNEGVEVASDDDVQWLTTPPGVSCKSVCKKNNLSLIRGLMDGTNADLKAADYMDLLESTQVCSFPLLSTCVTDAPLTAEGRCYMQDARCPDWRNTDSAKLTSTEGGSVTKLCACSVSGETPEPKTIPEPEPTNRPTPEPTIAPTDAGIPKATSVPVAERTKPVRKRCRDAANKKRCLTTPKCQFFEGKCSKFNGICSGVLAERQCVNSSGCEWKDVKCTSAV